MATTTWTASLKQLTMTLLLAATLAGCDGGNSRAVVNLSDDGGGSGDNGNDTGDNGGGNNGDGGGDSGGGDDGDGSGDGGGGNSGGDDDEPSVAIGGNVTGLKSTVVLRINDKIQLELEGDGAFSVGTELTTGSSYIVTTISQPSFPAQDCKMPTAPERSLAMSRMSS